MVGEHVVPRLQAGVAHHARGGGAGEGGGHAQEGEEEGGVERRHGACGDLLKLSRGRAVSSLYCAVIRCAEVSFCSEDVFVHMSFTKKTCTFEIIRTVSDDEYFRPLCAVRTIIIN